MIVVRKMKKVSLVIAITILLTSVLLPPMMISWAADFGCETGHHDFIVVEEVPPTQTENGYIVFRCEICGLDVIEILFATDRGNWVVEIYPTCTLPGFQRRDNETEEMPPLGHNFVETRIEPTCTEVGEIIQTCVRCGYRTYEPYGEVLEHQWEESITREATCEEAGELTFTCVHCDRTVTEEIPPLGHDFGAWEIVFEASEGVEGQLVRICRHCGMREYEVIEALPIVPVEPEPEPELPPELPEPERPWFGVEEAVVTGANFMVLAVFAVLLFGEFGLLFWEHRKKRELLEARRFEERGDDGYKYI
ncbi:MAG: hypothetical protein FWE25_02545 [Lachnospiraceae bacterium]|nr:hypothetical protein [Lachnospiraceae bacterium]